LVWVAAVGRSFKCWPPPDIHLYTMSKNRWGFGSESKIHPFLGFG
jgi:hypothetical protein